MARLPALSLTSITIPSSSMKSGRSPGPSTTSLLCFTPCEESSSEIFSWTAISLLCTIGVFEIRDAISAGRIFSPYPHINIDNLRIKLIQCLLYFKQPFGRIVLILVSFWARGFTKVCNVEASFMEYKQSEPLLSISNVSFAAVRFGETDQFMAAIAIGRDGNKWMISAPQAKMTLGKLHREVTDLVGRAIDMAAR